MTTRRRLALSRIEIFFIINFVMLGVVMYWTGLVVQPTLDILEGQKETTDEIIAHHADRIRTARSRHARSVPPPLSD